MKLSPRAWWFETLRGPLIPVCHLCSLVVSVGVASVQKLCNPKSWVSTQVSSDQRHCSLRPFQPWWWLVLFSVHHGHKKFAPTLISTGCLWKHSWRTTNCMKTACVGYPSPAGKSKHLQMSEVKLLHKSLAFKNSKEIEFPLFLPFLGNHKTSI